MKKFEKVEKTGIISTKFSLRCTPSVILGVQLRSFDYYFGSVYLNVTMPLTAGKHTERKQTYVKVLIYSNTELDSKYHNLGPKQ